MQILDALVFLYLLMKKAGTEVVTVPTINIIAIPSQASFLVGN